MLDEEEDGVKEKESAEESVEGAKLRSREDESEEKSQDRSGLRDEEGVRSSQQKQTEQGERQGLRRQVKQECIKLDDGKDSVYPEISCFSMSKEKKILCVGTSQINSKILIWDICSRTSLKSITLANVNTVLMVKLAFNNRHVLALCLTSEYKQMIYLLDSSNSSVIGTTNLMHSIPFKIKDLDFFPNSIYKFVTCGVQHMALWQLNGNVLSYQHFELKNPPSVIDFNKTMMDQEEDEEDQNALLKVIFITLIFVREVLITGGNDGYLYIWDEKKLQIKIKFNAHPSHPILTLHTTKDSDQFVSGGMDGKVLIWKLSVIGSESSYNLETMYQFDVTFNSHVKAPHIRNPEVHIQSVCIGSKYILAGTRTGDIYELIRPDDTEMKSFNKSSQFVVKPRFNSHDQEVPKSIKFSANSQKIYILTQEGLFSAWHLKSLKLTFMRHFQRKTHSLLVCKKQQQIIIAFEQQIIMLDASKSDFPDLPQNQLSFNSNISDVKLNYKEEILGVALDPSQMEQNIKIILYRLDAERHVFEKFKIIDSSNRIEFIDFSTDHQYMIYKDRRDELVLIDQSSWDKENQQNLEFNIEWCSDGQKVHKNSQGIHLFYGEENKLLCITQLSDSAVVVTDEIGTIRVFNYPCATGTGNQYIQCYVDHQNMVSQCVLSYDKNYLITSSETDNSIMIWKVHRNNQDDDASSAEQIESLDEEEMQNKLTTKQ